MYAWVVIYNIERERYSLQHGWKQYVPSSYLPDPSLPPNDVTGRGSGLH